MRTTNLDVQSLTLLGALIPLIVGLVTKKCASNAVKAITNLGLSAVTGGLAVAVQAQGHIVPKTWALNIASTFIVSIVTYYGLWKPTGAAPAVQSATENFGIGPVPEPPKKNNGVLSYDEMKEVRPGWGMTSQNESLTEKQAAEAQRRLDSVDDYGRKVFESTDSNDVIATDLPDNAPVAALAPKEAVAKAVTADKPESPLLSAEEAARRRRSAAAKKGAATRRANKAKQAATKK